ncbi:hypothetical protein [Nocardia sp.]|uniref:hypothetical protein n=1 Tax=Nocardia sp. TaxID=1821 RepID=UPI00261084B7|nr:hypothetical protein [Nocardia sp.]
MNTTHRHRGTAPVLIIELDEIDRNGTTYTRSALVTLITASMGPRRDARGDDPGRVRPP